MNRCFAFTTKSVLLASLSCLPVFGYAFDSGSTGADGAFNPTVNTQLALPPSGVFNFTSINIPAGVTVTFKKNVTNTPVVWLASGDVNIAGTVSAAGGASSAVGAAGDGAIGDDGVPGVGGPGGFDGGRGGQVGNNKTGGTGLGPGGGGGGAVGSYSYGGHGGGYAGTGAYNRAWDYGFNTSNGNTGVPGAAYGSNLLLPLIGGSGGGGGAGGTAFVGSGGGGGGGAILIASSGTINVVGNIYAYGGASGASSGGGSGGSGGAGSGGAIRLVAAKIAGNGVIDANANQAGASDNSYVKGGASSVGRIRLEAETITRTAGTTPAFTTGVPGALFISGAPTLTISSVAGVTAPAAPTGNADITLPGDTPNPVTVVFNTTGVPPGNTIKLTVTPAYGAPVVITSPALSGTTGSATASVSVSLPSGASVMSAMTTYTIVASLGDAMSTFAEGERVEKIALAATFGGPTKATLITVSGKEYPAPAAALTMAGFNG